MSPTNESPRILSVLVADDDRDAADSLAELLTLSGHHARTAYGGAEAIVAASADPPDVVLLDVLMPRVGGCEVARWLGKQVPEALLVAVTGDASEWAARRCFEAGFHHLLVKPAELDRLAELLTRARERRDARRPALCV
jgi:CheY-like chemotaxis protein